MSPSAPSDLQARQMLVVYVYEYLIHEGACEAAETFLSEIGWNENITIRRFPGFLHSWWPIFWDLYSTAKDSYEPPYSNDIAHNAAPAPSPVGQSLPNKGKGVPNTPSKSSHPSSGQSSHPHPQNSHGQMPSCKHFKGSQGKIQMPQRTGNDFNGPSGQQILGPMNSPRGPGMDSRGAGTDGPSMRGLPPKVRLVPGGMGPLRSPISGSSSPTNHSGCRPGLSGTSGCGGGNMYSPANGPGTPDEHFSELSDMSD